MIKNWGQGRSCCKSHYDLLGHGDPLSKLHGHLSFLDYCCDPSYRHRIIQRLLPAVRIALCCMHHPDPLLLPVSSFLGIIYIPCTQISRRFSTRFPFSVPCLAWRKYVSTEQDWRWCPGHAPCFTELEDGICLLVAILAWLCEWLLVTISLRTFFEGGLYERSLTAKSMKFHVSTFCILAPAPSYKFVLCEGRYRAPMYKTVRRKSSFFATFIQLLIDWLVGCLTSQQHASVSHGRICSDNFTCCYSEIKVEDQTFHLTQSQCTDTGPTSPSTDPITPGALECQFLSHRKRDSNPGSSALEVDALTTWPPRRFQLLNKLHWMYKLR